MKTRPRPVRLPGVTCPAPGTPTRFWHESWLREKADSEYRTGAVLAGLAAAEIEAIHLPRIGEVVWQGLPMASVVLRDGGVRAIPSPLTGVVAECESRTTAAHRRADQRSVWSRLDCGRVCDAR